MSRFPEGNAIVYCPSAFGTTNGKTAHGLVRRSERYRILSIIDPRLAGRDACEVLDGQARDLPILPNLTAALRDATQRQLTPTHLVVGLAPDGGRLPPSARDDILHAIRAGLNVDCGLHDFLNDDAELAAEAQLHHVTLRDVRRPPPRGQLHAFSGKITEVEAFKVAVLGTDSAVGKRTTAWLLVDAFRAAGCPAEMVGTGQTAWLQGARYGIILDSLINDFVAGEIEHAIWQAWHETQTQAIVIEGQGSLMNPAYPGGYEILAAGRPDVVVLQHAPHRREYDGFPGYALDPLPLQIQAIELLSRKPVVAITLNHEGLTREEIPQVCQEIQRQVNRPVFDVLRNGAAELAQVLLSHAPASSSP